MSERTADAASASFPGPSPADAAARAPAPVAAATRLYHLDAMRSVLMLLGVVLHAVNPYALDGDWLVVDSQRSAVLGWLGAAIHVFRMPAFFVVAGYFAMLMLRRYPAPGFLRLSLIHI
jgi:glucan biosynthesis protein C